MKTRSFYFTDAGNSTKHFINCKTFYMCCRMAYKRPTPLDTGYAWVILAGAFMMYFLAAGIYTTIGLFLVEFMEVFQTTKSEMTLVGTMQMFVGSIPIIFTGPLMKRFGCRPVAMAGSIMIAFSFMITAFTAKLWVIYVFYGVLTGSGFVTVYNSAMVAVQQYFHQKRALASGILSMGLSLGTFFWPPITRWLIDQYSWRGAMLIEAGIYLNGVVFGSLLRPRTNTSKLQEKPVQQKNDNTRRKTHFCIKHLHFIVFCMGAFGTNVGHMFLFAYTPLRADFLGISKSKAASLISIMGIMGLLLRLVYGYIGDRKWNNKTVMYGVCVTAVGVMMTISSQFKTFPLLIFHAVFFGTVSAGYIAVTGAVIVDTVGLQKMEVASAIFSAVMGSTHIILHSGTGVIQALGGLLVVSVPWIKKKIQQQQDNNADYEMTDFSGTPKHDGL